MHYTIVGNDEGGSNITVFIAGKSPLVAHSDHPNYDQIVEGTLNGDESVADLFDVSVTAASKFERLSERVTAANGRLYLDGEEVNNALANQVVRFLSEKVEDWKPLVNFFENVQSNPNEHSREQLYTWLDRRDFTITPEGHIVGYKGVRSNNDGTFASISTGKAIVNGEVRTGSIPQAKGDVVEMPRNEVQHDPSRGCHTGLHVGSYDYANGFAQGALLEVHVNPRDVVSVPTDCDWAKMRVCRYKVVDTIDKPYEASVLDYEDDFSGWDGWGDGENDDLGDDFDSPEDMFENQDRVTTLTSDSGSDTLKVGDKFEDLDKRRPRTLEVVEVQGDEAVYKLVGGSGKGTTKVSRLLTPYRFRKVSK
jgi:hypothetical protein